MDQLEVYAELRELIGSPSVNTTPNIKLDSYLVPALEWLADELRYLVREDDTLLSLSAGVRRYPLPSDILTVMSVWHNNNRVDPASIYFWQRDGTDHRSSSNGIPTEYSIQGRILWLNPPPSAGAITSDPALTIRYFAAPVEVSEPDMMGLTETDQRLGIFKAAILWCLRNPSDENAARAAGYKDWIMEMLPAAKRRQRFPDETYEPHFQPLIERFGGARRVVRIQRPILTHLWNNTVKEDLDCGPI